MTNVQLMAPDGVTIEAPADGWRECDCDDSSVCDDCTERQAED